MCEACTQYSNVEAVTLLVKVIGINTNGRHCHDVTSDLKQLKKTPKHKQVLIHEEIFSDLVDTCTFP